MRAPAIGWKHFAGVIETLLLVEPGEAHTSLLVPGGASEAGLAEACAPDWGLTPPLVELEGRQQPLQHSFNTTYAHVLPDEPGLQKIEFESALRACIQSMHRRRSSANRLWSLAALELGMSTR